MSKYDETLKICKEAIAIADALETLRKTKEWQMVIEKGFMQDNALEAVAALTNPQGREGALKELDAIAVFGSHLNYVRMNAENARMRIAEINELAVSDPEEYASAE